MKQMRRYRSNKTIASIRPAIGQKQNEKMSNHNDTTRDVRHVKAARELLRWNQETLAEKAGLSVVSVKRYEAARDPVADVIERQILEALEGAGVLFVTEGEVDDVQVAGGVLLRASARPEAQPPKRVLIYGAASLAGRPAGKAEASPRKPRVDRKGPIAD